MKRSKSFDLDDLPEGWGCALELLLIVYGYKADVLDHILNGTEVRASKCSKHKQQKK